MEIVRRPSHAGSWYSDNPEKLAEQLEGWLRECGLTKCPDVRGVIAPHAGYSYSGRAAAYAFGNIDPTNIWCSCNLRAARDWKQMGCAATIEQGLLTCYKFQKNPSVKQLHC